MSAGAIFRPRYQPAPAPSAELPRGPQAAATSDQPVQDPLRGMTENEARSELLRLTFRLEQINVVLTHTHYPESSVIRENLERERGSLESEAHDLEQRVIAARAKGELMWTPDYIYATRQRERGHR